MKNKYKNKLLGMALLASVLIVLIGTVSAEINMQGGNVVGQMSGLASGKSSAGAEAIAIVEHGTGSTNSNTNINANDAAGLAASGATASASAPNGGVVLTATVAWGNLKNALGGFSYDIKAESAKPGATAEANSGATVDLSADGESSVSNSVVVQENAEADNAEAVNAEEGVAEVVTTGAANAEEGVAEVVTTGADTPEADTVEVSNAGSAATLNGIGNFGVLVEELPPLTGVDQGVAVQ